MVNDMIDYGKLVDDAMHVIVKNVLKIVQERGLPGNHHFFISFVTKHPDVKMSKVLLSRYPREMTIVLQYQYQDLFIDNKGFGVTLSFNGVKESIYIPFAAITTFADPSVQFGLQFREIDYEYQDEIDIEFESDEKKPTEKKSLEKKKVEGVTEEKVVSLDQFRNKKPK
jgi:hypothetical protein